MSVATSRASTGGLQDGKLERCTRKPNPADTKVSTLSVVTTHELSRVCEINHATREWSQIGNIDGNVMCAHEIQA